MRQKGNVDKSQHTDAVGGIVTTFLFIEKKCSRELPDYLSQGLTVMRKEKQLGIATHTWNPSTQEAEAGDQPGLQSTALPSKKRKGRKERIGRQIWKEQCKQPAQQLFV